MRLPPFHGRVLEAVLPVCDGYGLVLAGGYAIRAHGFTDRPSQGLQFATAAEIPLPSVAEGVVGACGAAGLAASVVELMPRMGRLVVRDVETGEKCGFGLLREALRQRPVTCGPVKVLGLDDAVGLKMRALHERGLVRDVIDVASVAGTYSCRELEQLAVAHHERFSLDELLVRLEFVDMMDDAAFEDYGVGEERIREIRLFAQSWVEDIKLRRVEDGDAEHDDPDLPGID
ncbi:hypothetical protein [Nonomuraea zeae]|nr:hypothetical protein [Nonomuraea zeae]